MPIKLIESSIKKYFKKDLFQLIYHVTFKCNARCKFCFNWKELNQNEKKELSLEEMNKIARSMPNFDWLLLSGGEPSLRQDIAEIVGIFYKNNGIKHLTLPTNGLLPKRIFEIVRNLLNNYKNLTITLSFSLDSFGDAHDELRGISGCFKKLLESYELLEPLRKNKNLNIKFNSVIGNFNYDSLENLIKRIRELKPDMHTVDFIRGDAGLSLNNLRYKDTALPPNDKIDDLVKLIGNNYDYYKGYSNIKSHFKIMDKISYIIQKEYLSLFKKTLIKKKQIIPCLAHKTSLVLYPYGDVSFCEPLKPFANFRDFGHDYKKIIKSGPAKGQAGFIKDKKCVCYHPCFQYLNILFSPKLMIKGLLKNVF
jgi:MoaA/NifB/PqqE/SkfB family radical SAM enzyme